MSRLIITKAEFQELAELRQAEAKALLDQGKWEGAYYLAGYAAELALKACIIKNLLATDAFPTRDFSRDCYTHAIETLVRVAKLDDARSAARNVDPDLATNWSVAASWSEEKRYHRIQQTEAEELYAAISDEIHGVLSWIKAQW